MNTVLTLQATTLLILIDIRHENGGLQHLLRRASPLQLSSTVTSLDVLISPFEIPLTSNSQQIWQDGRSQQSIVCDRR